MSKATANKAIDFNRLFAVKDRLGAKVSEYVPAEDRQEQGRGDATSEEVGLATPETSREVETATVIDFPEPAAPPPALASTAPQAITALRPPAPLQASGAAVETTGRLRIGMPRPLHERVRASAALACVPPTAFVRDILEVAAPHFESSAPLTELTQVARSAFPEQGSGRRAIEVRMQVPVTNDLHRRLVQLGALRAQTLSACLLDLLEDRLPR